MNLCRNQSLEKAAQQQQLTVRLCDDFQLYFYRDKNSIVFRARLFAFRRSRQAGQKQAIARPSWS